MDKWMRRIVELAAGVFLTEKYNPSVVPYYPQKTAISMKEERDIPRSYPEKHGISSGRILALLKELEKEKRANIHNLMIVKDGVVISECSHPGYDVNTWHLAHSMSKSVTALAIGMLVDDGALSVDTPVYELFPEMHYRYKRFGQITVKNLLNMTSGVKFNEAGSVSETKWTEAFFNSQLAFEPGTKFNYNSLNSYILARIVARRCGRSLSDFLRERLFSPLGITNYFWEMGPEGVEKGGWGLYMSSESWSKIGIMLLNGGTYEGKRIISSDWIAECTSVQAETPCTLGNYNYGYQMWVSRDSDAILFNGMLGQDVWLSPRNNLLVMVNSGNNELFQKSPTLFAIETYLNRDLSDDLRESYFSGDLNDLRRCESRFFISRHWIRPYKPERHGAFRLRRRARSYPEEFEELFGRYNFAKNSVGILPLFVRAMQNNLKSTIDGFLLEGDGDAAYFTVIEGGVSYPMEIGFSDFKESIIDYHGEKYIVRVMAEAMEDEDRNMLYKLELLFPELPNHRMLKLSFREDGALVVRMSEVPNNRIADIFFEELDESNPRIAFIYDMLGKRLGKDFVQKKLKETFSPTLIGARVGAVNYTEIMDAEREKLKAKIKTIRVINTLIEKFLHDEDEMEEADRGGFRHFIGDIVERIKQKLPQRPPADAEAVELITDGTEYEKGEEPRLPQAFDKDDEG